MENTEKQPALTKEYVQALLSEQGYITVEGIAMDRTILVEGRELELEEVRKIGKFSTGFDWGYGGAGATQLALGLLLYLEPESSRIKKLLQTFKVCFVSVFPSDNFTARIHYTEWVNKVLTPVDQLDKAVHTYEYLEIIHENLIFSKFLDLPYYPFKNFIFDTDSIQHKLLTELEEKGELDTLNSYYKLHSKRKSTDGIRYTEKELQIISQHLNFKLKQTKLLGTDIAIKIEKQNGLYVAFYGFGKGTFKGNELGTYKVLT